MLLPVADDDSGWVRDGRLRSFEEVVGLEDTASGGSRLRTIAEELLDRQGLRVERFTDPLDAAQGNLAGYTTDADHYRSRILSGEQ
ncbi:hypothetical protein GTA09_21170 [Rhodococcus hoagii]|nr:hypothetical protein [Prescottella equi]NKZ71964.1 hypothetical protein [Prescottella equi]